jgi:hypothetical protein
MSGAETEDRAATAAAGHGGEPPRLTSSFWADIGRLSVCGGRNVGSRTDSTTVRI